MVWYTISDERRICKLSIQSSIVKSVQLFTKQTCQGLMDVVEVWMRYILILVEICGCFRCVLQVLSDNVVLKKSSSDRLFHYVLTGRPSDQSEQRFWSGRAIPRHPQDVGCRGYELFSRFLSVCVKAERLIAFALVSRYEKNVISQPQRLRLCHVTCKNHIWRSYDIQVRWDKALGDVPLSYSSRVLWWHTAIGLAALLQVKHI